MSIEAMKQAIEALNEAVAFREGGRQKAIDAIQALRTAIPQEESEPVGFVDFQGTVLWHDGPPPADSLLFAAKPVSHDKAKWCEYVAGMVFAWLEMQENLKEEDRCIKAITGIIERRMWALPTTHPAPDGWQLVPIEPTAEMLQAALKVATPGALRAAWARMLTAAQAQKDGAA